jgi:hypothetical protein
MQSQVRNVIGSHNRNRHGSGRAEMFLLSTQTDKIGGGGWTRTNDLGIMSLIKDTENKANQQLPTANSGKPRQNTQPRRNKKSPTPGDRV